MTINPVQGDDLLPMSFRNMVVNDLVGQIGFPLTQFLDEDRLRNPDRRYLRQGVQDDLQWLETGVPLPDPASSTATPPSARPALRGSYLEKAAGSARPGKAQPSVLKLSGIPAAEAKRVLRPILSQQLVRPRLSFANGLDTKQAFPSSQLLEVYGPRYAFEIGFAAQNALVGQIARNKYVALPDVQAFLRGRVARGVPVPGPAR
jgi:hypothetical protein